jgi:hypothetical protein
MVFNENEEKPIDFKEDSFEVLSNNSDTPFNPYNRPNFQ